MAPNGLKFTHSPHIDPLKRHCSALTIQSDPRGHFALLIDQVRKQENYENVLFQINNLSGNNIDLLKYVSKLDGMTVFQPMSVYKEKDDEKATQERILGNECFKKGNINQAFMHYSFSITKAVYPNKTNLEKDQVLLTYHIQSRIKLMKINLRFA